MKSIDNILVVTNPHDEKHTAIKAACRFVNTYGGSVDLMQHISQDEFDITIHPKNAVMDTIDPIHEKERKSLEKEAINTLAILMSQLVPEKFQGKIRVESDASLAEGLNDIDVDLIVADDSTSSVFKNSTDDPFIPVMVVSNSHDLIFNRVMLATDLGDAIPEKIFTILRALQKRQVEIHLVYIANTDMVEEKEAKIMIDEVARYNELHTFKKHIIYGASDKAKVIIETAEKLGADLVLMKMYQKSRFWRLLTDRLTEEVISESEIPLITEMVKVK